jgi:hypothetical protein
MTIFKKKLGLGLLTFFVFANLGLSHSAYATSAILSLSPSTGSFVIGSTFDVSIYLDTQGQSINTIQINLSFPADKLQLVSSSTGKSIIGIWTSLPKYDNAAGTLNLVGGVPNGIVVGKGLITTLTFRARAIGSAIVQFNDSKVLLNDGLGTEVLTQGYNSVYDLTLPPPAGPVVASDTHPDQTKWYNNTDAHLTWADEAPTQGYSYVLNDQPIDTPDDIAEGTNQEVTYHNLADGRHYFHIKALRNNQWGGVTNFAINVDASAPANFKIDIIPSAKTDHHQPVIQFATTDAFSGLDHYELKIVPLNQISTDQGQEFFIEVQSPYVTENLDFGSYDVIVRAFDNAGNVREETQRLTIATAVFNFAGQNGIQINTLSIPWWIIWLILILLLLLAIYLAYRTRFWHRHTQQQHEDGVLPTDLQSQMEELQKYRAKYGKLAAIILLIGLSSLIFRHKSLADTSDSVIAPPVITTVSKDITNEEIFYIGGKTGIPNSEVLIYLQNASTTETTSADIEADKNGEFFYRSNSFLSPGNYLIWSQTKQGQQQSPPSPQIRLTVESAAIQFGSTKLSFVSIYLILFLLSTIILLILIAYIVYHFYHGRRKHKLLMGQVSEAEASVRRGFAVLNRDMEAELEIIRHAKFTKQLTEEEKKRETQLLADLKDIEQYLSKEIWEIEDTEVRA